MTTIKDVIGKFDRFKKIDRASITYRAVKVESVQFAKKQFKSHGAYGGKPWGFYGSEPKYLAFKEAIGAMPLPLRWTSSMQRLYPALTKQSHPDRQLKKTTTGALLDIKIPYLKRIEQGGTNQFGEQFPARQIFPNQNKALQRDIAYRTGQEYYKEVRKIWQK